ncbi:MAG: hypothetical protein HPM95_06470 [Alphaproteobacteria bacterium]|nr:hypothetical protein [Alphaproteobacteria bacterium]
MGIMRSPKPLLGRIVEVLFNNIIVTFLFIFFSYILFINIYKYPDIDFSKNAAQRFERSFGKSAVKCNLDKEKYNEIFLNIPSSYTYIVTCESGDEKKAIYFFDNLGSLQYWDRGDWGVAR